MRFPYWLLLRLLPMWDYICPRCRMEVAKNSHKCPHCGESLPFPLKVPPKCLKSREELERYVHEKIFPKLSAWQREYLAQYFTVIFQDGFESGDFSAWTGTFVSSGASTVVNTESPHHGLYAQKSAVPGSASAESSCAYKDIGTSYSWGFLRAYVNYSSVSGLDANEIVPCVGFWVYSTSTPTVRAGIGKDSSGNLRWGMRYFHAGGWYNVFSSSAPELNTWYCMELECKIGAGTGLCRLYVNGAPVISVENIDNSARQFRYAHVGINQVVGTVASTVYTDCVIVADTYIGPEAEIILKQWSQIGILSHVYTRPCRAMRLTQSLNALHEFYAAKPTAKRTRLFLIIGDLAIQLSND